MSDELTYRDALHILGAPKSRLLTLLDAMATTGLTAWAATSAATGRDAGPALSLIELKADVIGYAHEVVRRVSDWRRGLSRFDRSQRLVAAHAVLIISSFFEALDEADLPVTLDRLTASDAGGQPHPAGGFLRPAVVTSRTFRHRALGPGRAGRRRSRPARSRNNRVAARSARPLRRRLPAPGDRQP